MRRGPIGKDVPICQDKAIRLLRQQRKCFRNWCGKLEAAPKNKLQRMEAQHAQMAIGISNRVIVMMEVWGKVKNQKRKEETL
jgi:hypothetical protein